MKKIYTILVILISAFSTSAQVKLDDFGRIILNTYLPENIALPAEAKNLLNTKLNQITSNNGMGGSQINPRFIITANVNVGTTLYTPSIVGNTAITITTTANANINL